MRPPIAVLLALCAVSASAATFESRSQSYALAVQVEDGKYAVRVFDVHTNADVIKESFDVLPADISEDVGDMHVTVRLRQAPHGISATAEIERGDMLLDSMHAVWMLKPRRAHIRSAGAMRVGGDVRPPSVVKRVEPIYPEEARRERVSGIVILEVLVDKAGNVRDAVVLKDLPGLSESALAAVRQWTFQPGTANGEPVDVIFNLTVNFKLASAGEAVQ